MTKKEVYSATITFDDNLKLIVVKFKDNVDVDIKEITILVNETLDLVKDNKFYLLVDARDILGNMDHESRKYFAEHKVYNELNIAQAILVNNMPIRLLATAYYRLYPHKNPVKIFSEISKAKEWLFSQC
jgi:hypothetical protein